MSDHPETDPIAYRHEETDPRYSRHSGTFVPVQYQDDDGSWRVKIAARRVGFDDRKKQVFLDEYRKHGLIGAACKVAGVSHKAIRDHREKDPDFDEACEDAYREYHDRLISHQQNLVFNGTTKKTYDRNGNIVGEEQIYPIRLIELELKAHDERYRDKQEVDVNVSGGVLIAPAEVKSIDDWESRFSGQTIEGSAEEVPSSNADDETENNPTRVAAREKTENRRPRPAGTRPRFSRQISTLSP